jgi:hypothetical protein
MGLFDLRADERVSLEAHVNVGISDERAACFLIPRKVMIKTLRKYYGFGSSHGLFFDPADFAEFIAGKDFVKVGTEDRPLDPMRLSCLKEPLPDAVAIMDGPTFEASTLQTAKSKMAALNLPFEQATSDLRDYQRYVSERENYHEEYYFASSPDMRFVMWCGPESGELLCTIQGEYDGMRTAVRYSKEDIKQVRPEEALDCVRAIGDLFRVR